MTVGNVFYDTDLRYIHNVAEFPPFASTVPRFADGEMKNDRLANSAIERYIMTRVRYAALRRENQKKILTGYGK